ncbi:MAG: hypothetical protein MJY99_02960 [Fibrobacter sp.]|nr:hypothetical protein [Fibrobacter sp.]
MLKSFFSLREAPTAVRSAISSAVLASSLAVMSFAQEDAIRFVPDVYPIGYVEQGSTKHIVLKGANVTKSEIVLENSFGQGIGMSNFKFPTKIAPNAPVTIEFDMDFSGMDGQINPVVVMVGTDGKPYTAKLDGFVVAPIFFGEKMFDAGYYKANEKREWTFYVWETDKKERPDLSLSDEAAKEFSMKAKNVMVKVDEKGKVTEGGKIPAQKITLSTKGMTRTGWELKQKSLRKIVGFKSKKYPKATPEVLIVGYWKD